MPPSLADLQRGFARLVTGTPPGDEAALGERRAAAQAIGVVGDDRLDAGGRVGIYAGMWFARIHDAIAEDHPATRRVLGDRAFADLLRGFLALHPPCNPSLRHAGERLALHASRCPPAGAPGWLAEMIAFEHAICASFDAGDESPLTATRLEGLAPEAWCDLLVQPVASLVVLRPASPVDDLRERLLADEAPEDLRPPPASLLVWRQDERVFHRRATGFEADLLGASRQGLPFAELCEIAPVTEATPGIPKPVPTEPATVVLGLLTRWLEEGLLVDTLPRPPS